MEQADRMSQTICIVTQQLKNPVSGVGIHANLLIDRLVRDQYRVLVITPVNQVTPGLPVVYYPVPAPILLNNQARWFFLALSFKRMLSRVTRENRIDLIHFTDARESLFYKGLVPAVGNINDTYSAQLQSLAYYARHYRDWLTRWAYYRIVHSLEKIALRRLAVVIANSRYTAGVIREQYNHLDPTRSGDGQWLVQNQSVFLVYRAGSLDRSLCHTLSCLGVPPMSSAAAAVSKP